MTRAREIDPAAADPAGGARKARDAAMALPIVGTILFLPPVAQIFAVEGRVLGVPVAVFYLFAVWGCLIAGAWWAGGRLLATEPPAEGNRAGGNGAGGNGAGVNGTGGNGRGRPPG